MWKVSAGVFQGDLAGVYVLIGLVVISILPMFNW